MLQHHPLRLQGCSEPRAGPRVSKLTASPTHQPWGGQARRRPSYLETAEPTVDPAFWPHGVLSPPSCLLKEESPVILTPCWKPSSFSGTPLCFSEMTSFQVSIFTEAETKQ